MEARKRTPGRRKARAATQDVLGADASAAAITSKWQKYYRRLLELRDRLANRRVDLASDAISEEPTFSSHMADAATDTYDRDLALGILSSEQDPLSHIHQPFDRIRNEPYPL